MGVFHSFRIEACFLLLYQFVENEGSNYLTFCTDDNFVLTCSSILLGEMFLSCSWSQNLSCSRQHLRSTAFRPFSLLRNKPTRFPYQEDCVLLESQSKDQRVQRRLGLELRDELKGTKGEAWSVVRTEKPAETQQTSPFSSFELLISRSASGYFLRPRSQ